MNNNQILNQQSKFYNHYLKIKNNPRYKKTWKYILKNKSNKKLKLLDIGCSNGDFSEPMIKVGIKCYGLEFVDKAIKEAGSKGIEVSKGSFLETFPFKKNTFDIIFAGEVIEHTIDDSKFLREVSRVIKPKGLFILTTPNLTSLGNRFRMLVGKLPRFSYTEFHYRIYNSNLIKEKVQKANFKITKFDSSYILISTYFNKTIGTIGELIGSIFPFFGEHFIIYAQSNKKQ